MTWSRVVTSPAEARLALAEPGDELDLRAAAELDDDWTALGFIELLPGELVRPVDLWLATVEDTRALGGRLAAGLRPGDLVVLSGPLGAGKTALTQGIGAGLGVRGAVTSPTYVLARLHHGPVPLLHVDAYRLRDAGGRVGASAALDDLGDLGLDDELPHAVTVVEWGEGIVETMSDSRLHVLLARGGGTTRAGAEGRSARVIPHGARWSVVRVP